MIHLNRESLNKWLSRHHIDSQDLKTDEEYNLAIKTACMNAINAQKDRETAKKTLLENVKTQVKAFKEQNLKDYQSSEIQGQSETKALVDYAIKNPQKGYNPDPTAIGYVGIGHHLSKIQRNNQKIFGGAGLKIHISIDPTIPGNRLKALEALTPILTDPEKGVVQYKIYSGSKKEDIDKWYNDVRERPGG